MHLTLQGTITHKEEGGGKIERAQRKDYYQGWGQGERSGQSTKTTQCVYWEQQQQVCLMISLIFKCNSFLMLISPSVDVTKVQVKLHFKQQFRFQLRFLKRLELFWVQSLWFFKLSFLLLV